MENLEEVHDHISNIVKNPLCFWYFCWFGGGVDWVFHFVLYLLKTKKHSPGGGFKRFQSQMFKYLPPFRSPKEIAVNEVFFADIADKDMILHNLSAGFLGDCAPEMPAP